MESAHRLSPQAVNQKRGRQRLSENVGPLPSPISLGRDIRSPQRLSPNLRFATGEDYRLTNALTPGNLQSLWLDNITRGLLKDGTLRRYIEELSITGLTSNPSRH
jgi:hypothetical protein